MHTFYITKTKLVWFELLNCLLVTLSPAPPVPGSQLLRIPCYLFPPMTKTCSLRYKSCQLLRLKWLTESTDFK